MIELPYFKFYPDEWLTGDVTMEEFDVQGIFANISAYYWKKDCNTSMGKLKKRYRNVTEEQWDSLVDNGIIKMDEDQRVRINFLDEQWQERQDDHAAKVAAGKKSAEKRWGQGRLPITESNTPTPESNNIDKDKEEIKIKKKMFSKPTLVEVTTYCTERKNKVDPGKWMDHYISNGWLVGKNHMKDWKAAVRTWERNNMIENKGDADSSVSIKQFKAND